MALLTNPRNSMHRSHPHHSLMLLLLLPLLTQGCVEEERQALLEFKRALIDPDNSLKSWNSSSSSQEDCCGWNGITCRWDGGEGHVIISLDLSFARLSGKISPSLLSLKHLEYLDLSGNPFLQGTPIPPFIGNFTNLTTLILGSAGLGGAIPPQLGMLRNLEYLNLGRSDFQGTPIPAFIGNFSKLTTLLLAGAGFGGAIPPQLGMLRNLEELDLSTNDFQGAPIPAFIGNLSNLTSLQLEGAGFGGAIPPQLGMLRKLQYLSIYNTLDSGGEKTSSSYPQLYVEDFRWISNLSSLERLQFQNVDMGRVSDWEFSLSRLPFLQQLILDSCNLTSSLHGGILPSLSSTNGFASLQRLHLSHNKQLGKSFFPTWFFSLNNLSSLSLADCSLDGVLTEHHFGSNLTLLEALDMSDNPHLHIRINPDWVPPFNLSSLDFSFCQVGPSFPLWLRTQQNLQTLILSSAGLRDSLPTWIWGFSSTLGDVDLSQNQLYDVVPDFSFSILERTLDLSSNDFSTTTLDLSSNNFSGRLPALARSSSVGYLNLSYNSFSGCLSRLICHNRRTCSVLLDLLVLDISNNHLSGEIPKELMNLIWLYLFNLSRNQLTGSIPVNIGDMRWLSSLDLSMNRLSGEIPQTITQLTSLDHLNVSHNKLTGKIPFGAQLQTFQSSSYIGNTLCGEPLPEKCDNASSPTERDTEEYKGSGDDSRLPFYVVVPIGYGAGTSAVFITLLFRRSWRIAYFLFIESILNKLF